MLRTSIASLACLALCAPIAWAQTTEKAPKSTKEASRPSSSSSRPPSSPPRAPTETKAKTPERSMTMQQEEAARLAKQRREEEEARRALYHQQKQHRDRAPTETRARTPDRSMTMQQEEAARLAKQRREEEELRRALYRQQQDNLRGQRFYPAPVIVEQQPQASPGLGAVGPVTAPATTPAPSRDIVVSCSAAPACAGAVCRSVASTYGGGNAASVGRRDIVTLCQQANSADACCIQECASTASCTER
jgi:exonuclease VII large subunit